MKKIIGLSILLTTFLSVYAYGRNLGHIEKAKAMTVLIANFGLTAPGALGSGVLLDEQHVLTCFHMLRAPTDELMVYTYPLGAVVRARIENVDMANDLAILVLDTPVKCKYKPYFEAHTEDGESITAVGNALGAMKWLVTGGIVSGREKNYVVSDIRINHGDSGGPWVNDNGDIVAISDWVIFNGANPGISGGVSASAIKGFFARIESQKAMEEALMRMLGGKK